MTGPAYIYRRYSTDEQGYGAAETLVRQKMACDALIAKNGWTVIGEPLTDKGKSAFKSEHLSANAELGKFVAAVNSGEVSKGSVLVAERLDRLSRRPVGEAMAWIHRLTEAGIIIALADTGEVFGAEQDLGSFLQTAIRAGVSHEESRKKSDATNKSKRILWDHAENRTGTRSNVLEVEELVLKLTRVMPPQTSLRQAVAFIMIGRLSVSGMSVTAARLARFTAWKLIAAPPALAKARPMRPVPRASGDPRARGSERVQ